MRFEPSPCTPYRSHIPTPPIRALPPRSTTPDDVPICEAYLAFLESNGNREAYWRVLSDAGLTRERLESFDRPITLEPDWWADKKDALIREFRNYLGILKAVHSGADLQASASAAGNRVPDAARGFLGYVLSHVRQRKRLRGACRGNGEGEWEPGGGELGTRGRGNSQAGCLFLFWSGGGESKEGIKQVPGSLCSLSCCEDGTPVFVDPHARPESPPPPLPSSSCLLGRRLPDPAPHGGCRGSEG